MGKADILEHLGSGQYRVRLRYNEARARAEIERLQKKIDRLDDHLADLSSQIDEAESDYSEAEDAYNQAIQDWKEAKGTDNEVKEWKDLKEAQAQFLNAQYKLAGLKRRRGVWRAERRAAYQRIGLLERKLPDDPEMDVWCADLTTNLSGEVATLEIPGSDQHVQLRPGYEDGATYDPARDGQLTPIMAQTPAQAFYNLAMLPGWQTWRPLYRRGTISEIDGAANTCRVDLAQEKSSAQDIEVNAGHDKFEDVPVQYMNCNAQAFQDGDEVVVEFQGQDWEKPRVIGFVSEPRRCTYYLAITINTWMPTRPHTVGLIHADTGDLLGQSVADQNGVASFDLPDGVPSNKILPALWYEGGDLFTHWMEDPNGGGIFGGFEYSPGSVWDPDKGDYGEYVEVPAYRFYTGIPENTYLDPPGYLSDTIHVSPVEWYVHDQALSELSSIEVADYIGNILDCALVEFDGLKKLQWRTYTREGAWDPEKSHFNIVGCGYLDHNFFLMGQGYEIECIRGTEMQNVKINSSGGSFDPDMIAPAYGAFGDTYHIEFTSETEFKVVGQYNAYNCGDYWSEDCIWLTDYQRWSVFAEGKISETCVVRTNGWFDNEPIFAIPPEAWSGTWRKGDVVQFRLSLGKFYIYKVGDDQWGVGGVDKGERVLYKETTSEELCYNAWYINDPDWGSLFNFYIERVAWRGVFSAGDMIKWGTPLKLAEPGNCEHGMGAPFDRERQKQTACVTTRHDYQAELFCLPISGTDDGIALYPDYYSSGSLVTCAPGSAPSGDDFGCNCTAADDGWCAEMVNTTPHYRYRLYDGCVTSVQNVPSSFSMRQIVPVTDSRQKSPDLESGGLHLTAMVKECGPWHENVVWRGGPYNEYELVCFALDEGHDGDVRDYEDVHFELIDTPARYI